ncbi:Cytochrome P450 monooxygenase FCK2 [Colletotrichum shisoi]|uniref:Cytochrome P450 monooxygenase FCK2 n=1 Tax=Colletotrichum shisoi TaxID=2078593 RepID=A0A5Q4BI53_9PEZI|nr:Cytochrome P450 monooxygenase FCK2 [Colletotrichum shisoi]
MEVQDLNNKYADTIEIGENILGLMGLSDHCPSCLFALGPTESSIIDPKANMLYSFESPPSCTKSSWYGVLYPIYPLQLHSETTSSGSQITPTSYSRRPAHTRGGIFVLTDWFDFYSFDVMGDPPAFGKSFGMMKEGIKHYFIASLHEAMQAIGMFGHML